MVRNFFNSMIHDLSTNSILCTSFFRVNKRVYDYRPCSSFLIILKFPLEEFIIPTNVSHVIHDSASTPILCVTYLEHSFQVSVQND